MLKYNPKEGCYTGECAQCHGELKASRPDAKFCDAGCRKRYSRRFYGVNSSFSRGLDGAADLMGKLDDANVGAEARKLLTELRDQINDFLSLPSSPAPKKAKRKQVIE